MRGSARPVVAPALVLLIACIGTIGPGCDETTAPPLR